MTKILLVLLFLLICAGAGVAQAQTSTESANTIREKVQEKIDSALNSPQAYIGTITDISESTLEIRNLKGDIQQVSVKQETDFVKITTTSKEVKLSDVAIGDFVIAMGLKNGNSVLHASRVLLTEAFKPSERKVLFVTFQEADTKRKTVKVTEIKTSEGYTVETKDADILGISKGKVTKIALGDLEQDQKLLVTGTVSRSTITARSIQVADNLTAVASTLKPTPIASPSSTPTPSPKATQKP